MFSSHVRIWVIVHRVDGLEPGAYRYEVSSGELIANKVGDWRSATESAVLSQTMAGQASAVIVMTVRGLDIETMGARAYRHAWLDLFDAAIFELAIFEPILCFCDVAECAELSEDVSSLTQRCCHLNGINGTCLFTLVWN